MKTKNHTKLQSIITLLELTKTQAYRSSDYLTRLRIRIINRLQTSAQIDPLSAEYLLN